MTTRLQTLKRAGFHSTGAIDAGAYRGEWTCEFWAVHPEVPVLLVEPQPAPQSLLREMASGVCGSKVLDPALSDHAGEVSFVLVESNSGIRIGLSSQEEAISIPCTTLAAILADRPEASPNLLKLDLQGHELAAMRGAGPTLQRCEVIICELSVIPISAFWRSWPLP